MWANLHLLFWLSLVPVSTGWVEPIPSAPPAALYGAILLMAALAWLVLERRIIAVNGRDSELAQAVEHGAKENASPLIYAAAIGLAFVAALDRGRALRRRRGALHRAGPADRAKIEDEPGLTYAGPHARVSAVGPPHPRGVRAPAARARLRRRLRFLGPGGAGTRRASGARPEVLTAARMASRVTASALSRRPRQWPSPSGAGSRPSRSS